MVEIVADGVKNQKSPPLKAFLLEPQPNRCLHERSKLVGIRFAAIARPDVRFRGDPGDIETRGGGR
jgi:hypothetical protein